MAKKTIISCAGLIGEILTEYGDLARIAKKIYPVIAPNQVPCPYVVYRRANILTRPDKTPGHADSATIEVLCCAKTYAESVQLAETVREALDGVQAVSDDGLLNMRSCLLEDATEVYDTDTYVQTLRFTVRIN